jgi:hypothetical protein
VLACGVGEATGLGCACGQQGNVRAKTTNSPNSFLTWRVPEKRALGPNSRGVGVEYYLCPIKFASRFLVNRHRHLIQVLQFAAMKLGSSAFVLIVAMLLVPSISGLLASASPWTIELRSALYEALAVCCLSARFDPVNFRAAKPLRPDKPKGSGIHNELFSSFSP